MFTFVINVEKLLFIDVVLRGIRSGLPGNCLMQVDLENVTLIQCTCVFVMDLFR